MERNHALAPPHNANGEPPTIKSVLVTGASGFIAKHIVKDLLEHGFSVRASTRSEKRRTEIDVLFPEAEIDHVSLDLTSDEGWAEALAGVDVLMHTASPFPAEQPDDPNDLIRPAVDGTLRALNAAQVAGVNRVVLTSSVAAVYKDPNATSTSNIDESNWTDPDGENVSAYEASKTLAERAAWDFVAEHPEMKLTVVNPGAVLGPALDMNYGTSLEYVERFLAGTDPMVPNIQLSVVDVRDVARIHVAAIDNEQAIGERYIAAAGMASMPDMAHLLAKEFPEHKISTRTAPDWMVRLMARFVPMLRLVAQNLGRENTVDGSKASTAFGFEYVSPPEAVLASARHLVDNGK